VERAFSGDSEAALCLGVALSNTKRGLWRCGMQRTVPRVSRLRGGWDHDRAWVIAAAGTRRRLAAMFHYAPS
jgi:hypothetical protein